MLERQISSQGGKAAVAVWATLSATGSVMFGAVMMLIAFYFLLVQGSDLVSWLDDALPLRPGYTRELLAEFRKVSFSVIVATVITSGVQAMAALAGFLISRVPHPIFFAVVTFFVAFVPAIGAAIVCLFAAATLYVTGHPYCCRLLQLLRSAEGLENEGQHVRGNGVALVADRDDDLRTDAVCLDDHGGSLGGVFEGIAGDVGDCFGQTVRVPAAPHVGLDVYLDLRSEFPDDAPANLAQVGHLPFERKTAAEPSAGEIQQLRDHPGHSLAAAEDATEGLVISVVEVASTTHSGD